ncbi:glycoside hydrolase family 2 protein [Herbiconiux sp. L3-i23]|uniref:glycoside hydrolase family 2 protein n=1 Tax=Herbiconiux sp. L3-i23 TaxID=2905871 RepID=UPI0020508597|nr:glycoside hydrolase family 2 protein [Herbiconiux sp. L3-i23]BDI23694.1 beta-mannosidase [Herbiconiux sp. L3-i23]
MKRVELHDGWTVAPGERSAAPDAVVYAGAITATVPGSVHTDLLAAGLIDDPYLDDNESAQKWIGVTDWTYRRAIAWQPDGSERQELVFDGIDTIASITLDGRPLAKTRNMHRSYRFDVTGALGHGDAALEVAFSAPVPAADAASLEQGYRPHVNHHPYNAVRKMACSFGWDWGIDTSTSGLWRGVRLETWSTARITESRVVATVVGGVPTAQLTVAIDRTGNDAVEVIATVGTREVRTTLEGDARSITLTLTVPDAELWWPVGHGEQPLYDLEIELRSGQSVLDRVSKRVGFRTVTIDTAPDESGAPFTIVVNGEPIFVRGANWIPDDAFPHRVDRARYARRIEQARFANINLLRVWGGGIYESDDFYAKCDERGVLVWQDFLLACAAYSEEEPMRSEIEAEAREAIVRLGAHPSLVLLNGNNENIWGFQEWGWEPRLDGRTWGSYYYYELFPQLVAELASHVAYTPGSPFSPDRDAAQNDAATGSVHLWDLWNREDYPHYRDHRPRFVAEFGWQGPPTWSTLTASISDSPLTPESPGMLVHQKAAEGNVKLIDGLVAHFPLPNDMADWHWAMSLNQAVAIRTGIEWFRSLTPHCTGTIVWQLNDCWPVTSWAAVDGYERAKPLLHALRLAYAERLLTIQPDSDGLVVVAVNDTADEWTGELELARVDYDGGSLASERMALSVPPRGTARVEVSAPLASPGIGSRELVTAAVGDVRAEWFFADYRHSDLGGAKFDVEVERVADIDRVTVTAITLVRDLTILVDTLDPAATADSALVTLLPGQTATIAVSGGPGFSAGQYRGAIRTAKDLVMSLER